ncbi:hypothetical protein BJX68DRAFT_61133 [Aspergillus pseudodeflectus]|uniref:DUF8035 domain-containing protein n=1 Tax=Aspergillus pseudodeflectus TaxID=176178 RepID=A0ABR4KIU1_9EURO
MPRRSRPVEYDDIVHDIDHDIYPSRAKGGPIIDREAPYGHRAPPGPYVEILERRHVRDRAQPEIPRDSYEYLHDGDRVAEKLERLDLDPYPREEIVESYRRKKDDIKRAAAKSRGRPRSRGMSEMEDAYYSTEESDEEYESESDEIVEPVRREKKRSISRHEYETRKEPIPRSRHPKEEKRVHRSMYEEEVYPKSGSSREDHMSSHRKSARYEPPPRPRHRSHYHVDIDDVESDESDESEGITARPEARIMMQKERIKNKQYAARNRAISPSSPSSLSSSADLSESELPKVPLPVPVPPPFFKEPGKKHKSLNHANEYRLPSPPRVPNLPQAPVPPRVPDLETVLSERDARQRLRKGRSSREEIEIERRSKESLIPTAPEPPRRRKEEAVPMVIEEPRITGHRDIFIEDDRAGPHMAMQREVIEEEDYYRRREPKIPGSYSSPSSDTMDGWAIVQAPPKMPKMKHTEKELVDIHEETRPPKQKHRRPKVVEKEERGLEINDTPPRGKVARRYVGVKDRKERLWTEITKDLVVKEAIERAGYEYEEMDSFYYIFANLHPDEVSDLIEESDHIRRARRRRLQEIQRERAVPPPSRRAPAKPAAPPPPPERAPSPPRYHREDRRYRDDRRRREPQRDEEIEEALYRARPPRW